MQNNPRAESMLFYFRARPPARPPVQHFQPKRPIPRVPGKTLPDITLRPSFPPPQIPHLPPASLFFPTAPSSLSIPKPPKGSFAPASTTKKTTADTRAERQKRKKEKEAKEERKKKTKRRVCPHCDGCGYIEEEVDEDDDEEETMEQETGAVEAENMQDGTVEGERQEEDLGERSVTKAKRKKKNATTPAKRKDLAATLQEEILTRIELPTLASRSHAPEYVGENEEESGEGDTMVCPFECGFETKSKETLKSHVRKHTGKAVPCTHPGCYRQFTTLNGLRGHIERAHTTKEKKYKCDYEGCTYATHYKARAEEHRCQHTGERKFKCRYPDCSETFMTRHLLIAHASNHKDLSIEVQKPFKCTFEGCGYRTNKKGSLQIHAIVHSDETPYVCTYCPAAFRRLATLKKHLCIHTGQRRHKCPYPDCPYDTSYKRDLRIHISQHTGERPYKCDRPGCTVDFAKKDNLRLHQRMHERKDMEAAEAALDMAGLG